MSKEGAVARADASHLAHGAPQSTPGEVTLRGVIGDAILHTSIGVAEVVILGRLFTTTLIRPPSS